MGATHVTRTAETTATTEFEEVFSKFRAQKCVNNRVYTRA